MAIEITGQQTTHQPGSNENTAAKVDRTEPTATQMETGKPSNTDTVSLTDTATLLQKVDNILVNTPVVDIQRVEGIRQLIADGRYQIDPDRVADKIIQFELALQGA